MAYTNEIVIRYAANGDITYQSPNTLNAGSTGQGLLRVQVPFDNVAYTAAITWSLANSQSVGQTFEAVSQVTIDEVVYYQWDKPIDDTITVVSGNNDTTDLLVTPRFINTATSQVFTMTQASIPVTAGDVSQLSPILPDDAAILTASKRAKVPTALGELTTLADDDVLTVYDTSLAAEKKITFANIEADITASDKARLTVNEGNITTLQTDKADKSNVLELDNLTIFTPTANYHPATKKYIDDIALDAIGTDSVTNDKLATDVKIGSLALLSTTEKSNVVGAVNELDTAVDLNTAKVTYPTADSDKVGFISITQAVDLDDLETKVNAFDSAVVLKGEWDASIGTFPVSTVAGETWIVSVAGTVDAVVFNVNDRIIALIAGASTTVYATNWLIADYTDQVLSVAGKTGVVVLDTDDVTEATNLYYTETRVTANTEVTANTAHKSSDGKDHSDVVLNNAKVGYTEALVTANVSVTANTAKVTYPSADSTKVGFISVTQAVDLDTMESDIATNVTDILTKADKEPSLNAQTGSTYTTVLTDTDKFIDLSNATATAVTIPTNASVAYPVSTILTINAMGAGAYTIIGDTGVTINGASAPTLTMTAQYDSVSLRKTATDTWHIVGAFS